MTDSTSVPPAPLVPPVRTRQVWDIVISIIFLVLGLATFGIGGVLSVFLAAFTDNCPPATCNAELGLSAVFGIYGVAAVLFFIALVVTIVLLVLRRRGWWVALIGLAVSIAAVIAAVVAYSNAIGMQ
jgi:MFS family permease